jgi:cell division protein FtsQ
MDGRGRIAQPLTGGAPPPVRPSAMLRARVASRWRLDWIPHFVFGPAMRRWSKVIFQSEPPPGIGSLGAALLIAASVAYGIAQGGHLAVLVTDVKDLCDRAANMAGFRIVAVALTGQRHVTREEVLATAGVTGTASLLLLDVDAARERLKRNPWIADATVLKLYPDQLQIGLKERQAFALWQKAGRVSVIADDGTVLEPYVNPRLLHLPLVVGAGAEKQAKDFFAVLDRHPGLRDLVRASVLVGERRWNLRLKIGIDVQLPETDLEQALVRLVALDHDKKLLSRDIVSVDLRLPDRLTVRLSDSAAQGRADALNKKPKKKGGEA